MYVVLRSKYTYLRLNVLMVGAFLTERGMEFTGATPAIYPPIPTAAYNCEKLKVLYANRNQ